MKEAGAGLRSIAEPMLDTTSQLAEVVITVLGVAATLAYRRPAIEPRHLRVDAGLVEEDEALRVDEGLRRFPQLAPRCDVRPVLRGGAQGFF